MMNDKRPNSPVYYKGPLVLQQENQEMPIGLPELRYLRAHIPYLHIKLGIWVKTLHICFFPTP
jgi:hypothetical protein